MRFVNLGQVCLALGMMGLGAISLVYHDFALQWQPVPAWVGARQILATLSGAILFAGGLSLLFRAAGALGALALTLFLLSWVVLLKLPLAAAKPLEAVSWLGGAEDLAMTCGLWSVFAAVARDGVGLDIGFLTSDNGLRAARILFGICCLVFGWAHFVYADFTAHMIPDWVPAPLPMAYITGAGHVAAGLALISGILPRLAATLEGVMMAIFVVVVHFPLLPSPHIQLNWTLLFVAISLTGSAFAIAWTVRDRPWGLKATATDKLA